MILPLLHRGIRRSMLALACAVLLAAASFGCSDDDPPPPLVPGPKPGAWEDLGLDAGLVKVWRLESWNGLLVAAGEFENVQGHPVSDLITWDGATWTRLEHPLGGGVRALAEYDGALVLGCGFVLGSTDTLPRIAEWDGTQWTPLGSGLKHTSVTALEIYEGDLIAAVSLDSLFAGGDSYVTRWDGASWQTLGGTFDGYVSDFEVFQGSLVAGGDFRHVGGVYASGIAAWNGTAWTPLGVGVDGGVNSSGAVFALTTDGTSLVAGGDFEAAGNVGAVDVARWNGTSWAPLGAGPGNPGILTSVEALTLFENAFVAGGDFGVDPVRRWDGVGWVPMSTLGGDVFDFTFHGGSLIAGGYFPPDASQSANGIARWVP